MASLEADRHNVPMARSLSRRALTYGFDLIGVGMDPAVVWLLRRFHFPAARLWAAANVSDGDYERFMADMKPRARRRAEKATARRAYRAVMEAKAAAEDATASWREVAIDGQAGDPAEAEMTRRRRASRHLATAAPLATAIGRRGLPIVAWRMTPPGVVAPPTPETFDPPSGLETVVAGPVYREGALFRQWLLAPTETDDLDDFAFARASWAAEGEVRGAVVAGSGVGVEWDLYVRMRADYDFSSRFTSQGLATVEIVSPGHGLRTRLGEYGGERFFAGAPVSSAALLGAQCRETGRMIAWARARWGRAVGVSGVSMSSFAAQLALTHAGRWPADAGPDAGFLLAHSGDLLGVVDGRLSRALGIRQALQGAGWTQQDLEPWRDALAPGPDPSIPGERIVSVVGALDHVTPSRDGRALAKAWALPRANRFTLPHGHMGLPMRVLLDDAPIARFADIVADAG